MHTSSPLVSVIVLTYNQENLLPIALESIVSQDFPVENYEVLVGEDKSTDHTAEVLKEYALKYPQIRPIFNAQNLGISKNFSSLLKECRGKYIMACAGDDYWLPGKMRFQVDFMENHPDISMIFGNCYCLEEGVLKDCYPTLPNFQPRADFLDLLLLGNSIYALTACYRRAIAWDFLKETDFENQNWWMEDYPMWLYMAKKGKIQYLPQNFCVYRVLENSASHFGNVKEKRILREEETWAMRLFFAEQYAPEYLKILTRLRDDFMFHLCLHHLWQYGFQKTFVETALKHQPSVFSFLAKWGLLNIARSKTLWNFLMWLKKHSPQKIKKKGRALMKREKNNTNLF